MLVPLHQIDNHSQTDIKTAQIQHVYREKYSKESMSSEKDPKPPILLTAKRYNDKEQQYNFDDNGDKIPIGVGMVQKNSQINVLKTLYRIHKDR